MAFSESLTVRVLGDSSELQRELDSVLNRFDDLKSKISETSNSARQFSSSFSRLSQALGPLRQVSQLIARIGQQLQAISQRPITLNVGPAIQSLQQLSQAAQQTAAAIRAIPAIPSVGPATAPVPAPGGGFPGQSPRNYASGGLVSGPSGIDRVPANLTSGEYVINRSAVELLGLGFLEQLNASPNRFSQVSTPARSLDTGSGRGGKQKSPTTFSAMIPSLQISRTSPSSDLSRNRNPSSLGSAALSRDFSHSSQTNNHFGGITIQVSDQAESESLLRNLQLQGLGRRTRQG